TALDAYAEKRGRDDFFMFGEVYSADTSVTAPTWRDACRTLSGCALPRLTGTDLVELAGLLAATELSTPGG
ncbi:hypothetical protein ABZS63_31635, partial [Streptomyces sp. NPDC005568]